PPAQDIPDLFVQYQISQHRRVRSNSIESAHPAVSRTSTSSSSSSSSTPSAFNGQHQYTTATTTHHRSNTSNHSASRSGSHASLARSSSRRTTIEQDVTALERINTIRSQVTGTVGADEKAKSRQETTPLPAMGGGKPYPPDLPDYEDYVVEFDGPDDPLHPQNWPTSKK
ncbi:hypothetical protein KEM55_001176, partial [Ascosphaera atra]